MQRRSNIKPGSFSLLFLIILTVHICIDIFISILSERYAVPLWLQLVLSELSIMIPGLIWMLIHDCSFTEGLGFKKIKISTVLMTILLAYLIMPLVGLINVVSQLFTENTVLGMSSEILDSNSLLMVFIIGLFGPFCEEFVFRGIIGKGMRIFGSALASALVSGLFFGLMHMNLNQFCYAFVLGVILAVVNYASGSIWTSVIMHMVVNTHNILLLLLMEKLYDLIGSGFDPAEIEDAAGTVKDTGYIYYAIAVFLVAALIFTAAAVPVAGFIAKNEGNPDAYSKLCDRPENDEGKAGKNSWWLNPFSIIATLICVVVIFFLDRILMILGL